MFVFFLSLTNAKNVYFIDNTFKLTTRTTTVITTFKVTTTTTTDDDADITITVTITRYAWQVSL